MSGYHFSKRVRFLPWIGTSYDNGNPWKRRVLIIGESHYSGERQDLTEDNANRDLSRDVIQRQWNGETYSYFTRLSEAVCGTQCREDKAKRSFWSTVSFYNFIQEIVSVGPRVRPNATQWKTALEILPEVIKKLEPDCVLATGKELWEGLPTNWKEGPSIRFEGKKWDTCEFYPPKGKPFRSTYIYHPSWPGFGSGSDWNPLVKSLLRLPILPHKK